MNGVEILNTIYEYDNLISHWWSLALFIATVIVCILGAITVDYDKAQKTFIILALCLFSSGIVCFGLSKIPTDEIIDTKYQVTISEEVSLNEFMEKYEILNQEGQIYTVREKK
jgi:hypothetical protein